MSTSSPLRKFLRRAPQPAKLRCIDSEGTERMVKIGDTSSRWRDAERVAYIFARVEALDETGNILRVYMAQGDEDPEEDGASAIAPASSGGARSKHEMAELARILGQVSDQSAMRMLSAVQALVDSNVKMMSIYTDRLGKLESAWHRLVMQQRPEPVVEEAQAEDQADVMVKQLMMGAFMGGGFPGAPQPQNLTPKRKATNGKPKE